MNKPEIDRIENAIRHIESSLDVDPWAAEIAVEAMRKQIPQKDCKQNAIELLKYAPTIETERKKGKWIEEPNCYYRCSRCSSHYPSILGYMDYKYCPNCGADMREEQNE